MIDYRIPVGATLESVIDFLVVHCSGATRAFSAVTDAALSVLEHGLAFIPWWLFIPAVALLTWRGTGSRADIGLR